MMVEFSLILPVLLLFLCGVIQYGYLLASYITVRNASAVAARYAKLSDPQPSTTAVQNVARDALAPMLVPAHANAPTVTDVTIGGVAGAKRVSITYPLPLWFPFVVPGSSGGTFNVTAHTTMR